MPKQRSPSDLDLLRRLPGVGPQPLAWAYRPDGGLVVIASSGQKLYFSPGLLDAARAAPAGDGLPGSDPLPARKAAQNKHKPAAGPPAAA
ncbi:MAG: hypothetical protein VB089_06095 [Anaerolineaceae bacterium]|nr:hypothetical protein [Anaerolineaceae bacterium]